MRKSTSESRNRSVREAYRHAVKQASRRWRAGHHDSAAGCGEAPRNLICALKKTIAAGSPPAGACSASNTMSDVPSVLVNMRSRPDVSQFVRSTVETTAERSAVGRPTLRAGAARGATRSPQATPANAARNTTLIGPDTLHRGLWLLLWLTRGRRFGRLGARECSPRLSIGAVRGLLRKQLPLALAASGR